MYIYIADQYMEMHVQTMYIYICISRSYMYTAAVIRSFLLPARPAAAGWMRQAVQGQKCTCAHVCMTHDHDCRSRFRHAAAQATKQPPRRVKPSQWAKQLQITQLKPRPSSCQTCQRQPLDLRPSRCHRKILRTCWGSSWPRKI